MKIAAQCLIALSLAVPVRAGLEEDGAASVRDALVHHALSRPGDGRAVCGLGREFHAGRRALLRERAKRGLLLFRGLPKPRDYRPFRQDKTFWYLTGIESPGAALLMDAERGDEILFLPKRSLRTETWEGELWDAEDEWVRELTGFRDVRPSTELLATLEERLGEQELIWISRHPHVELGGGYDLAIPYDDRREADPLDGRPSREAALAARLREELGAQVRDIAPVLADLRWVKTEEEIEAMRRAGRAGALAMAEAMRSTRPGLGEWELDALMSWIQVREGADGPAYHAIVGSGPNACVLHYSASSRVMRAGEVVLIDYGPELDHYTTDITRTWPVGGRFDEYQAKLYDAVLAAQAAGIAAVEPGATLVDVDRAAASVLRERGFGRLIQHSTCHYIGMEVHDVGEARRPLVPGVVLTVEPGAYDTERGVGVRIEDVVVVTEDGCEVLTGAVPKSREEVERLVGERGVLDWLDGER